MSLDKEKRSPRRRHSREGGGTRDPTRLSLVAFEQAGAADVVGKLRREIDRLENSADDPWIRDHVVNAFWTAWHIHHWMWSVIEGRPAVRLSVMKYRGLDAEVINDHSTFGAALARRFVPLKICRLVATAPHYAKVIVSQPDHNQSSVKGKTSQPTPMVTVMGRPVAAVRLLDEIDQYWVSMILDCGIE